MASPSLAGLLPRLAVKFFWTLPHTYCWWTKSCTTWIPCKTSVVGISRGIIIAGFLGRSRIPEVRSDASSKSSSNALLPFFGLLKVDCRKKGTLILTSEDLVMILLWQVLGKEVEEIVVLRLSPFRMWLWVKTNRIPFWGRCTTHFRTYFSGWIGMFTGGTIWILTHGRQSSAAQGRFPPSMPMERKTQAVGQCR